MSAQHIGFKLFFFLLIYFLIIHWLNLSSKDFQNYTFIGVATYFVLVIIASISIHFYYVRTSRLITPIIHGNLIVQKQQKTHIPLPDEYDLKNISLIIRNDYLVFISGPYIFNKDMTLQMTLPVERISFDKIQNLQIKENDNSIQIKFIYNFQKLRLFRKVDFIAHFDFEVIKTAEEFLKIA
jgi:hypothetical protein